MDYNRSLKYFQKVLSRLEFKLIMYKCKINIVRLVWVFVNFIISKTWFVFYFLEWVSEYQETLFAEFFKILSNFASNICVMAGHRVHRYNIYENSNGSSFAFLDIRVQNRYLHIQCYEIEIYLIRFFIRLVEAYRLFTI